METERTRRLKIQEIEWFDAQSSLHAMTIEEIKEELKPLLSRTIGYLVHETKDYVVMGFLDFGNGLIKHHQVIPKGMIVKRRTLK